MGYKISYHKRNLVKVISNKIHGSKGTVDFRFKMNFNFNFFFRFSVSLSNRKTNFKSRALL